MPKPKSKPPPLKNRGSAAWEAVAGQSHASIWLDDRHPLVSPVVTRAMVHAVNDETNKSYLKVVDSTLDAMSVGIRTGVWQDPQTISDLDCILAAITDDMIYVEEKNISFGQRMKAAWEHVFPDHKGQLDNFTRSVTGWNRLQQQNEGTGMCWEKFAAILRDMLEHEQCWRDREASIWWAVQQDLGCREQDLEGLRNTPEDFSVVYLAGGRIQVSVFFGLRSRGESVKTSGVLPNQGVIFDSEVIAAMFLELVNRRKPGERIFQVTRIQVMDWVRVSCFRLGIDCEGWGLHKLRHTKAANDIFHKKRTDKQVQDRGRWLAPSSVVRYTKIAHIVADLATLSEVNRKRGEEFLADPARFVQPFSPVRVAFSLDGATIKADYVSSSSRALHCVKCPAHFEAGRKAGTHIQGDCITCGCCVGTCHICFPSDVPRS